MTAARHIALLCATRRGLRCLQKIIALLPNARLSVFSFREEPWEPRFFEDIRHLAQTSGCDFYESRSLDTVDLRHRWAESPPDLLLAVSWRYLIPHGVYSLATLGAFVLHDSLLPAYRGFSPTVWALINNEPETGATLLQMRDQMDSGAIIDQMAVPIAEDDFIGPVMERVTEAYLQLLERNLPNLLSGSHTGREQDVKHATLCCKRVPEDSRIDWNLSASQIFNLIRASSRPYSGAFTTFEGRHLTVWSAETLETTMEWVGAVPGRITRVIKGVGVHVLTGDGAILLSEVQLEENAAATADTVIRKLSSTLGR